MTPTGDDTSGWYGLLSITREARTRPAEPVVACPQDAEPYTLGPDGRKHCRFCGHRPDVTEARR